MWAVTRRHNLDGLKSYLEYARRVTETVSFVSVQNDVHDRYTLNNILYHLRRSPYVGSVITRGCIAVGTADDMSGICSTAAICLHLHPFPVVWRIHPHVGHSPANGTRYNTSSIFWEVTSHRFPPGSCTWSLF